MIVTILTVVLGHIVRRVHPDAVALNLTTNVISSLI